MKDADGQVITRELQELDPLSVQVEEFDAAKQKVLAAA
jgi:hypothetical protein